MYVKIIKSGRTYEIYRYEREPSPVRRSSRRGSSRPRYNRPSTRTGLNAARTRKNFIRLVRSNISPEKCPSLVTLTMRDSVRIDLAYKCLTGFISNLRRVIGKDFTYVAVPEFQKRGAVHFHILFWGLPVQIVENERNYRYLQNIWSLGFVDCVSTDGSTKLAGYLAKYMSKSMSDDRLAGQKAYVGSRGLMRPVSYTTSGFSEIPDDFFHGDNVTLTKKTFQTQWMGVCNYELITKDV